MKYKCINCIFEGEKLSMKSEGAMHDGKCPVCGDNVKAIGIIETKVGFNLFDF